MIKQARIVEFPPETYTAKGFWYILQTLDGQPLRHAHARGIVRTEGAPQADPEKRAEALNQLDGWARENGWEIVED